MTKRAPLLVAAAWAATALLLSAAPAASTSLAADRGLSDSSPGRLRGLDLFRPDSGNDPAALAAIELGRRLFRDRRLSRDGSMACIDCHDPKRAYTNGRSAATGVSGTRGSRNVPTLVNRAWGKSYFWDGRAATLEEQVLQPILDSGELAMTADAVVALAKTSPYRERFQAALTSKASATTVAAALAARPSSSGIEALITSLSSGGAYRIEDPYKGLTAPDARTLREVSFALASYVRTIQSGDSRFDRYNDGNYAALSAAAVRGLVIFRGRGGCIACHNGPLLSDERFHNTGIAWRTGALTDVGRARVSGVAADLGAFKTPTLREVARTGPYMHDGSFETLDAVVNYYDTGGARNQFLDLRLKPLRLTTNEKRDLVAFLRSLNGVVRDVD